MLDYASILQAGQNLVPDLREEMFRDQELKMRQSAMQMQQEQRNAALQAAQQEAARKQQFQIDLVDASESGDPRQIHRLMLKYPEFGAQLKPGVDAMSADQRTRTLTQGGALYARLRSNDVAGAANILKDRIAADREAGQDVTEDEEMLAAIQSGDPAKLGTARTTVAVALAALEPDKFGETFGKLAPDEKQAPDMVEYDNRVAKFGKAAADQWLATQDEKFIPVQAGGSVFRASDLSTGATAPGGAAPSAGGLSAGGGGQSAGGLVMPFQGASWGQGPGAPRDGGTRSHNGYDLSGAIGSPVGAVTRGEVVEVGSDKRSGNFVRVRHPDGSTSSYSHLGQVSVGKGEPIGAGQTLGTLGTTGNARARPGNGVLHLVMRDAQGRPVDARRALSGGSQGPVQVRSKQQYDRLPSGTEYTAPDGSRRRKP